MSLEGPRYPKFKLETTITDNIIFERYYSGDIALTYLLDHFNLAKDLTGTTAVRLWFENSAEPKDCVLVHSYIKEEAGEIVPGLRTTTDTIGMSIHFEDADPVAECLVMGCKQHFHGDSRNDAVLSWSKHVDAEHRDAWND